METGRSVHSRAWIASAPAFPHGVFDAMPHAPPVRDPTTMTVLPRARTDRAISRRAGGAWMGLVAIALTGCGRPDPAPAPGATFTMRERVAALALRQSGFGSISVIPVRFEHSRIAGPFQDDGRTLYCVSARMMGRRFLKARSQGRHSGGGRQAQHPRGCRGGLRGPPDGAVQGAGGAREQIRMYVSGNGRRSDTRENT